MGASSISAAPAPDAVTWHLSRHRAILRAHPEVRSLFGADAVSGAWVVALAAAQVALAVWVSRGPWWLVMVLAGSIGAVIAHALGVLIHEASHNLVFHGAWRNKAIAVVANLGLAAPAAIEFRHQHLLHHKYLGDTRDPEGRDTQAPTSKEIAVVGHSTSRKVLSFTFGRFFYRSRPANAVPHDAWFVANLALCVAADAVLFALSGPKALAYLVVAALLAFGPHVLGARRVSEHLTLRRGQPTNSYYGLLNDVAFDVGYHVEHHDFPAIPWRRLRRLHAVAHADYAGLAKVTSWSSLIAAYFFDARYSVAQYAGASTLFLEEAGARTDDAFTTKDGDPSAAILRGRR
jgi:sphingolipid delta-4 desaturase